jgi:hypothetical protein
LEHIDWNWAVCGPSGIDLRQTQPFTLVAHPLDDRYDEYLTSITTVIAKAAPTELKQAGRSFSLIQLAAVLSWKIGSFSPLAPSESNFLSSFRTTFHRRIIEASRMAKSVENLFDARLK